MSEGIQGATSPPGTAKPGERRMGNSSEGVRTNNSKSSDQMGNVTSLSASDADRSNTPYFDPIPVPKDPVAKLIYRRGLYI